MTDVFAPFSHIRIINLPARRDRRAQMEAELRRIGLGADPRVAFFPGVVPPDHAPFRARGEKGVFLSHLAILREAAGAGASVLILEDDADFTPAVTAASPDVEAEIFYGGYYPSNPDDLHSSDIIGAHCMGFSAAIAARLVPYLEALLDHHSPPPIDGAYVWFRRAFPDVPTQFFIPPIAVQRPSRSDIARLRFFDRMPILRQSAGWARRLKRFLRRRSR